jgi:cell division protein FtsB
VSRPAPSHRSGAKAKAPKTKAKAPKSRVKGRSSAKAHSGAKDSGATGRKPSRRGPATRRSEGKHRATASPQLRRRRFILVASAAFAALVLGTSFPASGLLSDHRQLAATNAAVHNLRAENSALAQEQQQLNSKAEIHSLARQDYQLVDPGSTAYNVLPPTSQPNKSGSTDVTGDPGSQPVVAPAHAAGMSPDPDVPTTSTTSPAAASGAQAPASSGSGSSTSTPTTQPTNTSGGFWSRTLHSLEFWR